MFYSFSARSNKPKAWEDLEKSLIRTCRAICRPIRSFWYWWAHVKLWEPFLSNPTLKRIRLSCGAAPACKPVTKSVVLVQIWAARDETGASSAAHFKLLITCSVINNLLSMLCLGCSPSRSARNWSCRSSSQAEFKRAERKPRGYGSRGADGGETHPRVLKHSVWLFVPPLSGGCCQSFHRRFVLFYWCPPEIQSSLLDCVQLLRQEKKKKNNNRVLLSCLKQLASHGCWQWNSLTEVLWVFSNKLQSESFLSEGFDSTGPVLWGRIK